MPVLSPRRLLLASLFGVVPIAAGCGDKVVGASDLSKQVDSTLTARFGRSPGKVNCPSDLTAKVGSTARCTLTTAKGSKVKLKVTVNQVTGSTAHFVVAPDRG